MADGWHGTILITDVAGFGSSSPTRNLLEVGHRVTGLEVTPPSHTRLLQYELTHPDFQYV